MRIYGQRTADDRLAFGGRGAPYHFASRTRPDFDRNRRVHSGCGRCSWTCSRGRRLEVTHEWGGALAIPRDWHARRGWTGSADWPGGGYVGDGVATPTGGAHAGAADHVSGEWAHAASLGGPFLSLLGPEPLRWLGVNSGRLLMSSADRSEAAPAAGKAGEGVRPLEAIEKSPGG